MRQRVAETVLAFAETAMTQTSFFAPTPFARRPFGRHPDRSANALAMKLFRCDHCRSLLYFENHRCLGCGHTLAYLPEPARVAPLDPVEEKAAAAASSPSPSLWISPAPSGRGRRYRLCFNYTEHQVCNWAVASEDPNPFCLSCRLTVTIPDLSVPGHREAWYKLETAKRRLVHGLRALGLPVAPKTSPDDSAGLAFAFLADPADPAAPRVLTGHADGLVTLALAEADDAERERRRTQLHEPYRTLLGHLRHESGHYYWDRLVRDDPARLAAFRARFGDERQNYAAALQRHHATGAPADWQARHISAYASAHPWEDWAETWAHYLHMADTLETAEACGVRLDAPETAPAANADAFAAMIARWLELTHALNNLNRGLGQPDSYPFVLSEPVIAKLRFVHETVAASADALPAAVPRFSPRASSKASTTSQPASTINTIATPAST